MKDPRKFAREVIREYGGRVESTDRNGTYYRMPDGAQFRIGNDEHHGKIGRTVEGIRARYGAGARKPTGHTFVSNVPKPVLDLERLRASTHAKERLALMQSQRKVTFTDVLHTLKLPERVLYSPLHDSWLWVRDDLAVAVAEIPDGFLITTVMWSTPELFELHPRTA